MQVQPNILPVERTAGFSLVEAVISMVVVGVMLVAALNTLGGAAKARTINKSLQRGPALAHQLMAEVLQAAYEEPDDTPIFGKEAGETGGTRENFDDVDDFDAWGPAAVQTEDGTTIPNTTGWSRQVTVQEVDPTTLAASSDTGLKEVTVTVTDPQGKTTTTVALRSKSSPLEQPPITDTTIISDVGGHLQVGSDSSTTITFGTHILNQVEQ